MEVYLLIGMAVFMAAAFFLNVWRFARMASNPFAGISLLGMPIQGSELSVEQFNRMGRWQMIAAPFVLAVFLIAATQL